MKERIKDSQSISSIPQHKQRLETKAGFDRNGEKLITELANMRTFLKLASIN
jgi:hypothetical protein